MRRQLAVVLARRLRLLSTHTFRCGDRPLQLKIHSPCDLLSVLTDQGRAVMYVWRAILDLRYWSTSWLDMRGPNVGWGLNNYVTRIRIAHENIWKGQNRPEMLDMIKLYSNGCQTFFSTPFWSIFSANTPWPMQNIIGTNLAPMHVAVTSKL